MDEIDTPNPVHAGLMVDKMAMGQPFLKIFKFPILVSFHQCSILISLICHRCYVILAIVIVMKIKHLKTSQHNMWDLLYKLWMKCRRYH